jgi:hypothetical protein
MQYFLYLGLAIWLLLHARLHPGPAIESGVWAEQAITAVIGSLEGHCGSVLIRLRLDLLFFKILS